MKELHTLWGFKEGFVTVRIYLLRLGVRFIPKLLIFHTTVITLKIVPDFTSLL